MVELWGGCRVLWRRLVVLVSVVVLGVGVFPSCWSCEEAVGESRSCGDSFGCGGKIVGWIQLVLQWVCVECISVVLLVAV